jgi:hypothetical protein
VRLLQHQARRPGARAAARTEAHLIMVITVNAVARGELVVACTLCTWFYGMTTHSSSADLASIIGKAMDHVYSVHDIDEIRGIAGAVTRLDRPLSSW